MKPVSENPGWTVHRQDDNGNRFVVETGLTRTQADELAATLESRAHKQLYWVERDDPANDRKRT